MLDLHIKETLDKSLHSLYKKRPCNLKCVPCYKEKRIGMRNINDENATVKPWSLSFPNFMFLNLKRFDSTTGNMNTRACTYPMELNLYEYLHHDQKVKGDK